MSITTGTQEMLEYSSTFSQRLVLWTQTAEHRFLARSGAAWDEGPVAVDRSRDEAWLVN